jgi:hypothetical protein
MFFFMPESPLFLAACPTRSRSLVGQPLHSRPMPDDHAQEPGGWNRAMLQVADLPARIEGLKKAGFSHLTAGRLTGVGEPLVLAPHPLPTGDLTLAG